MRLPGLRPPALIAFAVAAMAQTTNPVYAELEKIQNNLTALHGTRALGWVSAPSMRGTSDILCSCLLTMFACIYTALHLDIPGHDSMFSNHPLIAKLVWSSAALFSPELVVFYASSQFFQARKLAKDMRDLHESRATAAETVNPDKVGAIRPAVPLLDVELEGCLPKRCSVCLT